MAPKANVFTIAVEKFLSDLSDLNHYQGFVKWQLEHAKASVETGLAHFDEKKWPKDMFASAHSICIFDMFHTGSHIRLAGVAGRVTAGDAIIVMADEMERRFNAFMLSYTFEALESYLRATYGTLLYQLRNDLNPPKRKAFEKLWPSLAKIRGTPGYFQKYAEWACRRSCEEAVAVFAKHLSWHFVPKKPPRLDFPAFIDVLGFCRNCIIHCQGAVPEDRSRKLSRDQKDFLKMHLHKTAKTQEVRVLPSSKLIDVIFMMCGSYARTLYVLLSHRCQMRDETPYFKDARYESSNPLKE